MPFFILFFREDDLMSPKLVFAIPITTTHLVLIRYLSAFPKYTFKIFQFSKRKQPLQFLFRDGNNT